MPKISAIVPVYNAEKYLHRCVDSILAQTFTDFELILVDDGSPDNCGAICDEYAQKDPRVVVIHQENQGQAAARNRAVEEANGEWIHFVDSDDMIHPQMLEILYCAAVENHVNISMCGAIESEEIPEMFYSTPNRQVRIRDMDEEFMEDLLEHGEHRYWVVWGKLIKKEIVQRLPFTKGRIYEDNAIVCQWLYEAGKVADLEERLYFYFINKQGTTKRGFYWKRLDYLWALRKQIRFFRKKKYTRMVKKIKERYRNWIRYNHELVRKNAIHDFLHIPNRVLKKVLGDNRYEELKRVLRSHEHTF